MENIEQFRKNITIYVKRKRHKDGRLYTLEELGATALVLSSKNQFSRLLHGADRRPLSPEEVLKIVKQLLIWEVRLSLDEAEDLLTCMDYPLYSPEWQELRQKYFAASLPQPANTRIGSQSNGLTQTSSLSPHLYIFQPPDLPKGSVHRPNIFGIVKHRLLSQDSSLATVLLGAGGFGKTTLALELCHDSEIKEAFPDGILWVELGEQPLQPRDVLNGLLQAIEPSLTGAIAPEEAQRRWRQALEGRSFLIMIDDVWKSETLGPLLEGGPQCKRLITTRNDPLLPKEIPPEARILVDDMEQGEAISLLCQGLEQQIKTTTYHPVLQSLVTRLGCWPLLIKLARGMLETWLDNGETVDQALALIEQAYEASSVRAFHMASEKKQHQTGMRCLDISLNHLNTFTPSPYDAIARYEELAIFPSDTDIPLEVIQRYWHETGGLLPFQCKDLCFQLYRLSLLLHCNPRAGTIRLHDVFRHYLIERVGNQKCMALHTRLLEACQRSLGLKRWADLPPNEAYLWHHLVYHLCQGGSQEALQETLTDLWYMTRKALFRGVLALEADLLLASKSETINVHTSVKTLFSLLHRSIANISHLLQRAQTPAEMGGLLLSHLGWSPIMAPQRLVLERELPRPFLTAWHPLPSGSSSALLRTLLGHTNWVNGCAISADGRTIVSVSRDKTLKVWDAATGAERLTLKGHTDFVTGCAISADGYTIVSASGDKTLKVWNATKGVERLTLKGHTNCVNDCAISADGRTIVSASSGMLKVWDAATGAERLTLNGHIGQITGCAISADGYTIVSASLDMLKVWDVATGAERLTLKGYANPVNGCAISADGRTIVSASFDMLKVQDVATGAEHLTLKGHTNWVTGCAISADGRTIVSASRDETLKVWDATTRAGRFIQQGHTSKVKSCAISADGRTIVSASGDETLKVWDATKGVERLTLKGHTSSVSCCAISADGRTIVSASSDMLKVWDVATGAEHLTLKGHTDFVKGYAISADGRAIVSASRDKTIKVWDVQAGQCVLTFPLDESLSDCKLSSDGQYLIANGEQWMYFFRLMT